MTDEMRAKRQALKDLSAVYSQMVKSGAIGTVNEGLAMYYAEQGHTTLKSYRQWQAEGFQVRKGSKALLMWGEPKPLKRIEEKATEDETGQEETFFPLAYVFSNLQVEQVQQ